MSTPHNPTRSKPKERPPQQAFPLTPVPVATVRCQVTEKNEGALVTFSIDPQTWKRLKSRMGKMEPGKYLWEEILHRAIEGSVY